MELPVDYTVLTWQERRDVRNEYTRIQGGLCHYCKNPLSGLPTVNVKNTKINWRLFPDNFLKYPVHLHHDHKTGMTIGAVHAICNAILHQYHGC